MKLSLKPDHLKRYRDIARLLLRYGDDAIVNTSGLDEALLMETDVVAESHDDKPEAFARDLESLGPTFIKLGQLLSTRPDLLPEAYITALSRLQDDVEPITFEEVEAVIQTELGARISKAFSRFDREPLAAASLGQVHRAALRDGREVAVKVQRPGIRQRIREDLEALSEVVDLAATHTDVGRRFAVSDMLEEFRATLVRELDYRLEAQNLTRLADDLASYGSLIVPGPIPDYSTSRILTMEFVQGDAISSVGPLRMLELDGGRLAEDLLKAYLDQVLDHGFFHADPHPGNILITSDGRLGLLDLGMVARLGPDDRTQLLKLLLAITEGRGREAARVAIQIARPLPSFDEERFIQHVERLVIRHVDDEMRDVNVGRLMLELMRLAGETALQPPRSLALLGKTLLNLDEISRKLDPDMQPRLVVRRHAALLMQRQMASSLAPSNILASALEAQEFIRMLPPRLNTILDKVSEDNFTVRVDWTEEGRFLKNFHQMVNRLSLSIVVAALIVGAAMLMQVDTDVTILGYPAIAMVLFLAAFAFGFALALSILFDKLKS